MSFWKKFPPGWFVWEGSDYGDGELRVGDGDDDDDDTGDGGGDGGDGGDGGSEDDGDGGRDYAWETDWSGDGGDGGDSGGGDGGDSGFDFGNDFENQRRDEERQRRREDEQRRQDEARRQEEERQARIEEQRRQIEERRRQMDEENRRRMADQGADSNGDGIPDQTSLSQGGGSYDPGAENRLNEQFQNYEQERQAQEANYDPNDPSWIYRNPMGARTQQAEPPTSPAGSNGLNVDEYVRNAQASRAIDQAIETGFAGREFTSAMGGPAYQPGPMPETPDPSQVERASAEVDAQLQHAQTAANAAAGAMAAQGGGPQEIAQAAETAARMASDRQTLAQQSAWTRAAFRSQYGDQADAEWVRQHENELKRNYYLYGSREPTPGTAASIEGLPAAPNRRIGATPAPTSAQEGYYGVNLSLPGAAARPVESARSPAPGVTTPAATGAGATAVPPPGTAQGPVLSTPTNITPVKPLPSALPPDQGTPIGAPSTLRRPQAPGTTGPTPLPPSDREDRGGRIPPEFTPGEGAIPPTAPGEGPPTAGEPGGPPLATGYEPNRPVAAPRPTETTGTVQQSNVELFPGRYTPIRNIVPYDPETMQTGEQGFGQERYASQDTAIPSEYGTGQAPYADPVLAAISSSQPLATLASLAATNRGPDYDARQDEYHIAHGIAGMLRGDRDAVWAEPYLNDVARMAWAREERQNGRGDADPRNAPIDYIEHWKDAFYGSDHSVPLVKEVDQEMIDAAAQRTPPGQAFRWQDAFGPTGEKGLISQQVTEVDCGPNAFSTILRSRGYNADPNQTFSFARKYGYHNGNEFAGPAAMVRMLNEEAGLKATSAPITPNGQGWEKVDAELAAGRPVMLSSRGHWWVVSAKNDQGQYYAGATSLKGNPQWMARGGFSYGGPANTAVFTEGDVNPQSRSVRELGLKPPTTVQASTRPLLSGNTEYARPQPQAMSAPAAGRSEEPEDFTNYVRWSAARKGVDPDQVSAVLGKEGPGGWAAVGRFNTGTSYGPLQLHYAGGSNPQAGMGDRFTKATGIDLRTIDPTTPEGIAAHKKAVDYALDELIKAGDWHEWYGADKALPGGRYTPIKRITPTGRQAEVAPTPGSIDPRVAMMRVPLGSDGAINDTDVRYTAGPETLETVRYRSPGQRLQDRLLTSMYKSMDPNPETAAGPTSMAEGPYIGDARHQEAVNEDVWSNNQPARQSLMVDFQALPLEQRREIFDAAVDEGLAAEGIKGDEANRWKQAMYQLLTGQGINQPGENPDFNPYMIAGESGGRPGTADRLSSSATGYFQLIDSKPDGSDYAFRGYRPKQYGRDAYNPVGQVRQFIRAIKASTYRGDPMKAVADKRANGHYNIIVSKTEQSD